MLIKLDCEKYLNTIKDKAKKYIKENDLSPKLMIFNPVNDENNQIYVRSKKKHLIDVGVEVISINDSPKRDYDIGGGLLGTGLFYMPCLVQKTEEFDKNLFTIYEQCAFLKDIEYINAPNKFHLVPTPNGIVNMLKRQENVDFTGKHCVIINRSEIIGKPLIQRLLSENATVSVCHSSTNEYDLVNLCNKADFIFSGVGIPKFINSCMLNLATCQCILDFGISRDNNGILCGDVNVDDIKCCAIEDLYYTPTPKGTGLTTIAQLIENVVEFYGKKPLWEVK